MMAMLVVLLVAAGAMSSRLMRSRSVVPPGFVVVAGTLFGMGYGMWPPATNVPGETLPVGWWMIVMDIAVAFALGALGAWMTRQRR